MLILPHAKGKSIQIFKFIKIWCTFYIINFYIYSLKKVFNHNSLKYFLQQQIIQYGVNCFILLLTVFHYFKNNFFFLHIIWLYKFKTYNKIHDKYTGWKSHCKQIHQCGITEKVIQTILTWKVNGENYKLAFAEKLIKYTGLYHSYIHKNVCIHCML